MKQFLMLFFGLLVFSQTKAQNEILEQLWKAYRQANSDTAKANCLINLSTYYSDYNFDSSFILARQALHLAQNKGDKALELKAMMSESLTLSKMGAGQQALKIGLKCMQGSEEIKNEKLLIESYKALTVIYSEIEDYDKGIEYCYKIIEKPGFNDDKIKVFGAYVTLGDLYWRKNQLDSARHYNNKAFELAEKMGDKDNIAAVQNNFGNIFLKMQQPDMALLYYRQCLPYAISTYYTGVICESSLGIAKILEKRQQYDSAIYYSHQSFTAASNAQYSRLILQSSDMLGSLYTRVGKLDSSVKYLNISMSARDSLYNSGKLNLIKAMELQDAARKQDQEREEELANHERRQNIQYAIILVGIITLFVGVLLLSRSFIVNDNWIRFLGVLSLLLVFEFVNLFLHPFLIKFTDHSPVVMLFLMALIASILIPIHHRMEHWITSKLIEKNKQIRLAKAKSIVESLGG
jgi:tetratricopeptide (TPR) repeat protein